MKGKGYLYEFLTLNREILCLNVDIVVKADMNLTTLAFIIIY